MIILDDNYELEPNQYVDYKIVNSPVFNSDDEIKSVIHRCLLANLCNGMLVRSLIEKYLVEMAARYHAFKIDIDLQIITVSDDMVVYEKDSIAVI